MCDLNYHRLVSKLYIQFVEEEKGCNVLIMTSEASQLCLCCDCLAFDGLCRMYCNAAKPLHTSLASISFLHPPHASTQAGTGSLQPRKVNVAEKALVCLSVACCTPSSAGKVELCKR